MIEILKIYDILKDVGVSKLFDTRGDKPFGLTHIAVARRK